VSSEREFGSHTRTPDAARAREAIREAVRTALSPDGRNGVEKQRVIQHAVGAGIPRWMAYRALGQLEREGAIYAVGSRYKEAHRGNGGGR